MLAINILGDRKALYRVSEFYRDKDLETIFDEDVTVDALNDSALAHALDGKKYKSLDKVMEGVLPQGLWTSGKGAFITSRGMCPCAWRRRDGRSVEGLYNQSYYPIKT